MVNSVELMQLCRLCLVKDQVNIPIFDSETDVQQIFLKISTCLPVKVAQDDNLPKKICSECSYKLDLCYQFWNTSANSEKQLLTWLNEVGLSEETLNEAKLQKSESNSTPGLVLKQEAIEPESESLHEVANNVSTESQEYILQQQQLPYQTPSFPFSDDNFVSGEAASAGASKAPTNNKREATLKRKRQAAATVTQPDSDDDVDDEIDDPTETKVAKTEETSDDDRDDDGLNDEESTEFAGVPSTSADNEQPGPSGIGKNVVDAPYEDIRIKSEYVVVEDSVLLKESALKLENLSECFYKCNSCGLMEKYKEDLRTHMRNVHKKTPSLCRLCYIMFEDINDCRRHKRKFHPRERMNACKYCNRVFEFNCSLRRHMEIHEDRLVIKCEVCDKKFVTEEGLKAHTESHTGQNCVSCNLCGKKIYKKYLKRHMLNMHNNEKPFKCHLCPKTFRYDVSYKDHVKKHLPDYKPPCYKCEECGKEFSHERSIAKHKKEHQEEKRYIVCELCGKALTSSMSLKKHLLIHKGEKPHTCETCGKAFTAKHTLRIHRVVHTKEKPFVCRVCDKGFTQSHSLKFHMRSFHTHEKPYECTVCEKRFVSKNSLNAHVKTHGVCP